MASFEVVSAIVKTKYREIWAEWYAGTHAIPARLQVEPLDVSSGYSHSQNLIIIGLPEGNLGDADILDENGWPIWKTELVHEMLHEWQSKTPCSPTGPAEVLCEQYVPAGCGQGHGPEFFQAIIERTSYFEMTPEQLIEKL